MAITPTKATKHIIGSALVATAAPVYCAYGAESGATPPPMVTPFAVTKDVEFVPNPAGAVWSGCHPLVVMLAANTETSLSVLLGGLLNGSGKTK